MEKVGFTTLSQKELIAVVTEQKLCGHKLKLVQQ